MCHDVAGSEGAAVTGTAPSSGFRIIKLWIRNQMIGTWNYRILESFDFEYLIAGIQDDQYIIFEIGFALKAK